MLKSIISFIIYSVVNSSFTFGQSTGRWLITADHPQAIIRVDSLRFIEHDARTYPIGKYHLRA